MSETATYQQHTSKWFAELRDKICTTFETIETELTGTYKDRTPGKFERKTWQREGGGGGEMSIMRGRVFEKVGVNISTVHGEFSETMRREIPDGEKNPFFFATGISLVAHPQSPLVPAVHMNTRMLVLSSKKENQPTKHWFGGGADLTPMLTDEGDTKDFHAAFKSTCGKFSPEFYEKYKKWCDEYFFLKHRNEPRGVGGIFYDYLNTDNIAKDFEFTKAVGETFHTIYPQLVRRHMDKPWTKEQREHQLVKRGRYAEFNLIYDRGTRFGLMTGGNTEAILMSLPPEAKWP